MTDFDTRPQILLEWSSTLMLKDVYPISTPGFNLINIHPMIQTTDISLALSISSWFSDV